MSPPAASIPNSDFNFTSTVNQNPNFDRCSFNSGENLSYSSINKNNQPSSARPGPRRARLVKQRKSCKTTSSLSGDAVINPFRSVSSLNDADQLNGFSNYSDIFPNSNNNNVVVDDKVAVNSFVFGVPDANNGYNNSINNVGFVFSGSNLNKNGKNCNGSKNSSFVSGGLNSEKKVDFNGSDNVGFIFGGLNSRNKGGDCNTSGNVTEGSVEGSNVENGSGDGYLRNNVSVEKERFSFTGQKVRDFGLNEVKRENGEVDGVAFTFGASVGNGKNRESGVEFGLSEELEKLKIERNEKGGEKVEDGRKVGVSSGDDQYFVFGSGGVSSKASGKSAHAGETSNNNGFVFGSTVNCTSDGGSVSQSSSFSTDVDGDSVKDVLRVLFSSLGAEGDSGKYDACFVSEEKKADCGLASTGQSFVRSFPEFKLPEFDVPLSFSSNMPSEPGKRAKSSVKARGLRDKHSKKTRAKPKHAKSCKPPPIEIAVSSETVPQAQEAAECFSPMDFSPYEETTTTNDVSVTGQEVPNQSKVENGTLFEVYTESRPDPLYKSNGLGASTVDPSSSFGANVNSHDTPVAFNSEMASKGQEKLAFTTSSPAQNGASSHENRQKKKYRMKSTPSKGTPLSSKLDGVSGNFVAYTSKGKYEAKENKLDGLSGNFSAYTSKGKHEAKENKEQGHESAFTSAEKACEKWRRRGNEAYERGEHARAEHFYTLGVNCIAPGAMSDAVSTPLVRCYSNRAATRMSLGRVREAVQDCLMAVKLDPTFHRAQMRAANCYLQLGELKDAMRCFGNIIESSNAISQDRKVIVSASEGIQKCQKVTECINHSAELLRVKTSEAATSALKLIAEALSMSIHCEQLLEMKAEAFCMLRRHDEALALCEKSRDFAEKNFTAASFDNHEANGSCSNLQRWRQRVTYKCYFHLGKLEEALDHIEKDESRAKSQASSDPLALTIRELLREKSAGNAAFQTGNHLEAIEHYTTAILSSMDSRPFAAICFCNRAASHQALGHIADAISDCSLAIALDENYTKAVSRRATLHEMIRDYRQAAVDLQRMIFLLEKQPGEKSKQSGSANGKELRQVRNRLSVMEEEAKRDTPLDLYNILGVTKSDPAAEIKKAYRKAALRHHPDKAGQSLARSDGGDEGRHWKDIAELVHKDSDRLFKMIGEAYAVLSDPKKREEYDEEEEMRKAVKERNNLRSTSRRHSESYYQGYPFERSNNRRYWQDSYTYSYSSKRW